MAEEIYTGPPTDLGELISEGARRDPFAISQFIAEVDRRGGLFNPNLFTVAFPIPESVPTRSGIAKTLTLLCETAAIPGVTLGTDDTIQRYGWGPTHRAVWGMVFTPLTLEFIVDMNGAVHDIMTSWINSIVLYNVDGVDNQPTDAGMPFMVNYVDRYCTDISVHTWDSTGKRAITHKFIQAFPIRINEIPLSSSTQNGLTKMTVQFSYVRHVTNYLRLTDDQVATLQQNTPAGSAAVRDAVQGGVDGAIANNLVGHYRSMFTPTPAAFPPITDSFLNLSNGILGSSRPRPIDSNFDTSSLFTEG